MGLSIGNSATDEYSDFIIFIDERNEQQRLFVKILDTTNLVKFQTKGGNIVSIPPERLIKLKQKGDA